MSRVGKKPVPIPDQVKIGLKEDQIEVKGPKGTLSMSIPPRVTVEQQDAEIVVKPLSESREGRAMHGLARALIANMVTGVADGFEKDLEIVGVGYRVEKTGEKLMVRTGFSHPVEVTPLPGITLEVEGANRIRVMGIDKEVVGQMAAKIRSIRPPDAYKGKGIRYAGEVIRLKPGKAGKAVGSS